MHDVADFVGDDEHVVFNPLGEGRDLRLGGAPCIRAVVPTPLLDYLGAEPLRGPAQGFGEKPVAGPLADDQEPLPPALPNQILRQTIGQHGPAGRDVHDVVPAIPVAQPVIRRPYVKEEDVLALGRLGHLQQPRGRHVGNDKWDRLIQECPKGHHRIAVRRHTDLAQDEFLLEEPTRRIVVLDREPPAGEALVLRQHVQIGELGRPLDRLMQISDGNPPELRRPGRDIDPHDARGRCGGQHEDSKPALLGQPHPATEPRSTIRVSFHSQNSPNHRP